MHQLWMGGLCMYKNDRYRTKINIALNNGIYLFSHESATGKTRLAKELLKLQAYGEPVASYTYNDKLLGRKLEDLLIPHKYKVIMLDRYDMYEGDGAELINQCRDNTVILIDCKEGFQVTNEDEDCFIEMRPDWIGVTA